MKFFEPVDPRRLWRGAPGLLFVCTFLLLGCSGLSPPRERPTDPFPRWVESLEVGVTTQEQIRERFGTPDAVAASVRGGLVWQYAHSEIHWPPNDPWRPKVSGAEEPRGERRVLLQRLGEAVSRTASAFHRLVHYPPPQNRLRSRRRMPTTVHSLAIVFDEAGALARYRYEPSAGETLVFEPH